MLFEAFHLSLQAFLAPEVGCALAIKRKGPIGPILSKEPVVGELSILLANNLKLCRGRMRAVRISSIAEDGARGCLPQNGSLIHKNEFFGASEECNRNVVEFSVRLKALVHGSRLVEAQNTSSSITVA